MGPKASKPLILTVNLCSSVAVLFLAGCSSAPSQSRQEHIHHTGHNVMPFDLDGTLHIFQMTETGGVQRVFIKDPGATDQIPLIRQHLEREAMLFASGDFSDPAALHGATMPGLNELQAGASRIKISYSALPMGGEIRYDAGDIHMITAIHRWFGAQLSEHGADAVSE
jgi:hypothetical protein